VSPVIAATDWVIKLSTELPTYLRMFQIRRWARHHAGYAGETV